MIGDLQKSERSLPMIDDLVVFLLDGVYLLIAPMPELF
jgi:hypothetical protein